MLKLVSNLFGAVMEGLGFARERSAAKNTPEMQANARAQTDADIDRKIAEADAKAAAGDPRAAERLAAE